MNFPNSDLLNDSMCRVCKKPLNINNHIGFCGRHSKSTLRYQIDAKYRKKVLAKNKRYYDSHKQSIIAKHMTKYYEKKTANGGAK